MNKVLKIAAVLATFAAAPTAFGAAEVQLSALAALQPGQWELRETGGGQPRSLCIGDPRLLLQIRHGSLACTRFTITNDARTATVQYSCQAAGHGRTTLRAETPRLVQIHTQGVADKSPFQLAYEGRRTGPCTGSGPAPQARRNERATRLGIR